MKWPARLAIPFTLIVFGVISSPASAQPSRIAFTIADPDGKPVEGATLTVTTKARGDINFQKTTNKKGKATFMVPTGVLVYQIAVEAEGYSPVNGDIKPSVGGTTFREITITPVSRASTSRGATTTETGEVLEIVFTEAEKAFNEGVEALRVGDFSSAEIKFLEARTLDAEMIAVHSALATVYIETNDFQNALGSAERFVDLAGESTRGQRLLYEAHSGLGNTNEAKKALKRLTALGEGADTAALLFNEGADAMRDGDIASAEERFLEALEIKPDFLPPVEALMLIYARQGKWAETASRAETFLATNPDNVRALSARYDAYSQLGDEARSQEAFDALAQADPSALAKTFVQSGITKFNAGDIAAATVDLERVVGLQPDNATAHYHLGLAYTNSEEGAKAKEHFEKFLALAPDDANAPAAREMMKYL